MDKISGILPATARITAVDLRNSGTARSGTPGFGRAVGVSTVAARQEALETAEKANLVHKEQINLRNFESDPKSQIVQKMADNFFINNAKAANTGVADEINEGKMRVDTSAENVDINDVDLDDADQELGVLDLSADSRESSDDELMVGQHLDVRA